MDEALLRFLVFGKLSFNFLTTDVFGEFINIAHPAYNIPVKVQIRRLLSSLSSTLAYEVHAQLKTAVAVSFTTDLWTEHRSHIMAITAHCIHSNGEFTETVLPLYNFHGTTKGTNIVDAFHHVLHNDLHLDAPKFLTNLKIGGVTTDNASNMISFGTQINIQHVRCIAHNFNLAVRLVFDQADISSMLSSVRNLCNMFRLQHKYIQALKRADPQERTTILDVPKR
jgi:hypothetical protein